MLTKITNIIKFIHHYSHAIMHRAELLSELLRAKSRKIDVEVPWRELLRSPSRLEHFIIFCRFISPADKVILLDIGANTGEWCEMFIQFFPLSKVICFEPISDSFQELQQRFAHNQNIKMHKIALSNQKGKTEINVGEDCRFSSFHNYVEDIRTNAKEIVETDLLDNISVDLDDKDYSNIIKIDVQGHEVEVLQGMQKTLKKIDILLIETSFLPEYQGKQPSFSTISKILLNYGLYPAIFNDYGRKRGFYAVQRDVFFVRGHLLNNVIGY